MQLRYLGLRCVQFENRNFYDLRSKLYPHRAVPIDRSKPAARIWGSMENYLDVLPLHRNVGSRLTNDVASYAQKELNTFHIYHDAQILILRNTLMFNLLLHSYTKRIINDSVTYEFKLHLRYELWDNVFTAHDINETFNNFIFR
jgi:hypothetical protein